MALPAQSSAPIASADNGANLTAVPEKRKGFVQVGNAFVLDPAVPNDAKILLMVFYAEAKGSGMVRLSQREIRDRTNMPPERQDDAIDWIMQRRLVDVISKKGAKPVFVLRPSLLVDWVPNPDWERADETRKPRDPVGKARVNMEHRQRRQESAPLFDEPSATSGSSAAVPGPKPSAASGNSGRAVDIEPSAASGTSGEKLPLTAGPASPNFPLSADAPSATSGKLPHSIKTKTVIKKTSSIPGHDDVISQNSIDDACEMLRAARVNIYPHEVGVNRSSGRRLTSADLIAWLDALQTLRGLDNPAGYVAKAIRLGCTFAEDRSRIAERARDRADAQKRRRDDNDEAAERSHEEECKARELDEQIAHLAEHERRELEVQALRLSAVWNARDASPEIFEAILRVHVRRIYSGKVSADSGERDYGRCRNEARINAIRSHG